MTRFIKSQDGYVLARLLGLRPRAAVKQVFDCCADCGPPLAQQRGFKVHAPGFTARELEREFGLKTSRP